MLEIRAKFRIINAIAIGDENIDENSRSKEGNTGVKKHRGDYRL